MRSLPRRVRYILLAAAAHLGVGMAAGAASGLTADWTWLTVYFQYQGALFLVFFAALEFGLALSAYRCFSFGDRLRSAWLLITAAAGLRFVGFVLSELLGKNSFLNPNRVVHLWSPEAVSSFRQLGLIVGGPIALATLCMGLWVVRGAYRHHDLLARLRPADRAIVLVVLLFAVRETYDGLRLTLAQGLPFGASKVLSFTTEPLLCVLLYTALAVRRSALSMARGLIAKCWGSYGVAVLFTTAGNIGLWAVAYGHVPWQAHIVVWYVWFLAATAFVLGPAYQLEAIRRAISTAFRSPEGEQPTAAVIE
jgi:hypothetical protein